MTDNALTVSLTLNNGNMMPVLGLGTWNSPKGAVQKAVEHAIQVGYRHIDCAHIYGNEKEVGDGIRTKILDGTVKRDELFITSKLWNTSHQPRHVEAALDLTLQNLGLEYLDMYLMHWPIAYVNNDAGDGVPFPSENENKFGEKGFKLAMDNDAHYTSTWKEMCRIQEQTKKLRNVGVSNFNICQLKRCIETGTAPQTNQVEVHAYHPQVELVDFCKSAGIAVTAYSPLANPGRPASYREDGQPVLLDEPELEKLAALYSKTKAQILLRWLNQRGIIIIPKSVTPHRIEENSNIFDFKLTEEEVERLRKLETRCQTCAVKERKHSKFYPFVNDYTEE